MNQVVALALVGAIAWGVWAVLADLATRSMAPEVAMIVSYSVAIVVAGVYTWHRGTSLVGSDPTALWFAGLGGVAAGVGAVAYYMALQVGSAGIATTVTAMYFVVAAAIGIVVFGNVPEASDLAGIAAAVAAVALIAY